MWTADAHGFTVFSEPGARDILGFWTGGPGTRVLTSRDKRRFGLAPDVYDEVPVIDLHYVGVRHADQGHGYGRQVHLHFLEVVADCALAPRFLYLECWEANPAHAVYERWGWTSVGRDRVRNRRGDRAYLSRMLFDRRTAALPQPWRGDGPTGEL